MPLAVAVTASNGLFAITNGLIPGAAEVVEIP
jgi:hypothetical protein